MRSELKCPACQQFLTKEIFSSPRTHVQLFCENPRCPSSVSQTDGGSSSTEMLAYVSLCNAIDNEMEGLSEEEQKDRNAWAIADRHNDQTGFDGK